MTTCEDFPCCGHTDGLGCNWVSPNEIQLCMVCADARADRPYHDGHSCKTVEEAKRKAVPAGAVCISCNEEEAEVMSNGQPMCFPCESDMLAWSRDMQEQYDDYDSQVGHW